MTPTISTTFTYRAVASEFHGYPKSGSVERNDPPSKRRPPIFETLNRIFCEYLEASLLAAFSWVISFLVTGIMHCATSLHVYHGILAHLHLS